MPLFNFLFPESHHSRLKSLDDRNKWAQKKSAYQRKTIRESETRIEELENQVGALSLVLAALLDSLESSSQVDRAEMRASLEKLDLFDGQLDGKLPPEFLNDWIARQND